jgi:hypothetical protein
MPSLQKLIAPDTNKPNHIGQFVRCEPDISCHGRLFQPNLCRSAASLYMDVRWLVSVMADEIQAKALCPQDRWHRPLSDATG